MANFALLLTRLTLGALFVLAGVRKLIPPTGKSMTGHLRMFVEGSVVPMSPLPDVLSRVYGYALPFVEILAGFCLVLGLFTRLSATIVMLLLISFIIATGPQWWPASGPAFSSNIIFAAVALLLATIGPGRASLDSKLLARGSGKMSRK